MQQPRDEISTPAAPPPASSQKSFRAKPSGGRTRAAFVLELPTIQGRANAGDQGVDPSRRRAFGAGCNVEQPYTSSGSDHEPSSVCLAAMVDQFMEDQATFSKCGTGKLDRAAELDCSSNLGGELVEILKDKVACTISVESKLLAQVCKALGLVKDRAKLICTEDGVDCTSGCLKRAVMKSLRDAGYNAAICKSRWDQAGGFPGGDYEYIDVLIEDKEAIDRLIVDVNFREEFEIARPTDRYNALLQELPLVYVGKKERLQSIVNLMCDAVKESLKKRGMPLPPWRKPDYMQAKWFSAYKRTTNEAVQPHKRSESAIALSLSHTAIRGSRWDPKFTSEFERQLQQRAESSRKPANGLAEVLFEAGLSTLAKQQRQQHQQQQQQMSLRNSLVAVS